MAKWTPITGRVFRSIVLLAVIAILPLACKPADKQSVLPIKITIAHWTGPSAALVHIALAKGFFTDEGLDASPQPHPFGKLALDTVLEGKADIATAGDTPIVFAVMNGKKVSVLATIQTANKNEAIIALRDRGITKPFDLKGKNIGVTLGTTADFFLDSFLLTHGIERNQVNLIDMHPAQMPTALEKGLVDAVSTFNPTIEQLDRELGVRGIVFFDQSIYTEAFCAVARQDFVDQHPETVKKFLRALIKAETFTEQHNEEARTIAAKFTQMEINVFDTLWRELTLKVTLDQALLVDLEDQTRWVLKNTLSSGTTMPNYLDYLYIDGLNSVKADAVRIVR